MLILQKGEDARVLLYEEGDLPYVDHTIEIKSIGQKFEIFKLAYRPSLQAKRWNASDGSFKAWDIESDGIGGSRQSIKAHNVNLYTDLRCTKVWIYGTMMMKQIKAVLTIGDIINTSLCFPQGSSTGGLLYESKDLTIDAYHINYYFYFHTSVVHFYYIYYLPPPDPTPTASASPSITPKCNQNCEECDENRVCSKCFDGFSMLDNECREYCPGGMFSYSGKCVGDLTFDSPK